MRNSGLAALVVFTAWIFTAGPLLAKGASPNSEVKLSTNPIGSAFLRHLAFDHQFDLYELVKFEKKGFGRTEIIALAFIAQKTGRPMKEYGKRRLSEKGSLRSLAEEAQMNFDELYAKAQSIKETIDLKGERDLPPPLFEKKPEPTPPPPAIPMKNKDKAS